MKGKVLLMLLSIPACLLAMDEKRLIVSQLGVDFDKLLSDPEVIAQKSDSHKEDYLQEIDTKINNVGCCIEKLKRYSFLLSESYKRLWEITEKLDNMKLDQEITGMVQPVEKIKPEGTIIQKDIFAFLAVIKAVNLQLYFLQYWTGMLVKRVEQHRPITMRVVQWKLNKMT